MNHSGAIAGVEIVKKAFEGTQIIVNKKTVYEALIKSKTAFDVRKNVMKKLLEDNRSLFKDFEKINGYYREQYKENITGD
jgi:hypothetical protein